jgi:nucleoid DNA-binding protein
LEQEFPSSLFIQRMKAQAWLGILQYRLDNSLFSVVESKSKLEGASGKVHHFIKEMSKHQLITMCIRQVTEVYRENTADSHVKAVFEKMIEAISYEKRFELEDYFEISFQTAYSQHFQNSSASHTHELPDSSDFHLYLIPDLKRDTSFLRLYNFYHQSYLEEQRDKSAYSRMSAKERYYYDQKKKHRKGFSDGMKSEQLICMEPIVLQYGRKGLRQVKSEKTKETFRETIDLAARQARIFVFHLDRKTTEDEGTQAYNDRCVLVNYLEQSANNSDLVSFPVDYSLVHQVKEKFGTPYVLYSVAKHGYYPDVLTPGTLYALLFFPAAPVYFPIKFFSGNQSEINMIVLDLETGKVEGMMSHKFKSTLRKHVFGAHIYSLFDTLNPN